MDNKFFEFVKIYEADLKAFFEALVNFFKVLFDKADAEEAE